MEVLGLLFRLFTTRAFPWVDVDSECYAAMPRLLLFSSALLVTLLAVLSAQGRTSAAPIIPPPQQVSTARPPVPNALGRGGASTLPPMAPGIVLIGPRADVRISTNSPGVEASATSLNEDLAALRVQSAESVFPSTDLGAGDAAAGDASNWTASIALRLASDVDILRAIQVLGADPAVAFAEPDYRRRSSQHRTIHCLQSNGD